MGLVLSSIVEASMNKIALWIVLVQMIRQQNYQSMPGMNVCDILYQNKVFAQKFLPNADWEFSTGWWTKMSATVISPTDLKNVGVVHTCFVTVGVVLLISSEKFVPKCNNKVMCKVCMFLK